MEDVVIWPWRPLRGMVEIMEWLTDVMEAHDGTEQRIQLRQAPRQIFEAQVMLDDPAELSKIRVALAWLQHRLWGWPCWHEAQTLGATLTAGATSIPVDTTSSDYAAGGYALLWSSPSAYEMVEIDTVSVSALTLATSTVGAWPAGAFIMPLRRARMSAQVTRDDHSTELTHYAVQMTCVDNAALATEAAPVQYLGYDVLADPLPLPGETMPRKIDRSIEVLDPGMGAWATSARTDYPLISTDHRWRLKDRAQAWAFRRWLHRRAGMLNPVWIPSRRHDLTLAAQPSSSSTTLEINDVNYRNVGPSTPGMTHIAAFSSSGAFVCRQITNAVAGSAGRENLTINSALGFSDVTRISFLCLHRFAADRVSLTWDRVGVAECRATMTGVAG